MMTDLEKDGILLALKKGLRLGLNRNQSKWLCDHIERLQQRVVELEFNAAEHKRLKRELGIALNHDAESPSMCDLVAVARLVMKQNNALSAMVERLEKDTDEAVRLLEKIYYSGVSLQEHEQPTHEFLTSYEFADTPHQSLAEHDAEVARVAFIEGVEWAYRPKPIDATVTIKSAANDYAQRIKAGDL